MHSLERNDYPNATEYKNVLKTSLLTSCRTISARGLHGSRFQRADDLFGIEAFFKWKAANIEFLGSVLGPKTYPITIFEHRGSGSYYFKDGYNRKEGNIVEFIVTPPIGFMVGYILLNGNPIDPPLGEVYSFEMPDESTDIEIYYTPSSFSCEWSSLYCIVEDSLSFSCQWSSLYCLVVESAPGLPVYFGYRLNADEITEAMITGAVDPGMQGTINSPQAILTVPWKNSFPGMSPFTSYTQWFAVPSNFVPGNYLYYQNADFQQSTGLYSTKGVVINMAVGGVPYELYMLNAGAPINYKFSINPF